MSNQDLVPGTHPFANPSTHPWANLPASASTLFDIPMLAPVSPTGHRSRIEHYDAVVVGARVAGAATAMLMARDGARVLVVDKAAAGSDTLSTHALMRGAVTQLDRWGLLDRVIAAGTPAVHKTIFRYDGADQVLDIDPLYAPRRTVLDPIMAEAAVEAGADVRFETKVVDLSLDGSGRVDGVSLSGPAGDYSVSTDLLIGADGLRSWVARKVGADVTRSGAAAAASIAVYVEGADLPDDAYVWACRPGLLGGSIPTNFGQNMVFVSVPNHQFRAEVEGGVPEAFERLLKELDGDWAEAVSSARQVGRIRSWPGHVGQFRKSHGPGWALVGDAGYFKDPGAAHGISDAFRDAELLARAAATGDFAGYERTRDELSAGLFDALEVVADYSWTMDDLPQRHLALGKAMSREHKAFHAHLAAGSDCAGCLPAAA